MLALVNDLLDVAKIKAEKLDPRLERVDLEALLRESLRLNQLAYSFAGPNHEA